jgi:hypothetical protein
LFLLINKNLYFSFLQKINFVRPRKRLERKIFFGKSLERKGKIFRIAYRQNTPKAMQDASFLQLLQEKLLEKINYQKANYTAVAKLSQSIEDSLGEHISETTLKRIFNLIPVQSEFRTSTLDILAQYIGYATWDKFKAENDFYTKKTFQPTFNQIVDEAKLLKICLKNHHFDTVLEYISEMPMPVNKKKMKKVFGNRQYHALFGFLRHRIKSFFKHLLPNLLKSPQVSFIFMKLPPIPNTLLF